MYSIRLFEGYENSFWYQNGGYTIIRDLMDSQSKYNIKFFHGNPWNPHEEKDCCYQDESMIGFETQKDFACSPYFVFSNFLPFRKIEYNLVADKDCNGEKKDIMLWSVCSEHDAIPFIKDIFEIEGSDSCPFVLEKEGYGRFRIIKNKNTFSENDKAYFDDMCFDNIGEKYYLMSDTDIRYRRSYQNEQLSFKTNGTLSNCSIPFTDMTWISLKVKNN